MLILLLFSLLFFFNLKASSPGFPWALPISISLNDGGLPLRNSPNNGSPMGYYIFLCLFWWYVRIYLTSDEGKIPPPHSKKPRVSSKKTMTTWAEEPVKEASVPPEDRGVWAQLVLAVAADVVVGRRIRQTSWKQTRFRAMMMLMMMNKPIWSQDPSRQVDLKRLSTTRRGDEWTRRIRSRLNPPGPTKTMPTHM